MPTSSSVELAFPVFGEWLPTDHAYSLYGALAANIKLLHDNSLPLAIGPVSGTYAGDGRLQLDRRSRLRLRLPADLIAGVLPLAGQALEIVGHRIRLGVPQVFSLVPATSLIARLVTIKIKGPVTPENMLSAVQARLTSVGISGKPDLPLSSRRVGEPQRRALRIKSKRLIGYAVQVTGLSAEESLALQSNWHDGRAIFSRRKLGCGFFVPLQPTRSNP